MYLFIYKDSIKPQPQHLHNVQNSTLKVVWFSPAIFSLFLLECQVADGIRDIGGVEVRAEGQIVND